MTINKPSVKQRRKRQQIDWSAIREDYLTSDKDLYEFSFEHSGKENYPAWATLDRRARLDKWKEARIDDRLNSIYESQGKSQVLQDETHIAMRDVRRKLLSADTTINRHIDIANSLQSLYFELLPKIKIAAKKIDWDALAADPRAFVATLKDLNSIMIASVEIERKAMSLSDVKIELQTTTTNKTQLDITTKTEELKAMTDSEVISAYLEQCRAKD